VSPCARPARRLLVVAQVQLDMYNEKLARKAAADAKVHERRLQRSEK